MRASKIVAAATVAGALAAVAPAGAQVCVTVTVYQAGAPTTSGPHCQPLLDKFGPRCVGPIRAVELGYGAEATVCAPRVA